MPEPTVLLEVQDSIATITLNRPQSLNAYTLEMAEALGDALDRCGDGAVRAVVLTGAGRAFCAGADLRELVKVLNEQGPQAMAEEVKRLAQTIHARIIFPIRELPKPVIGMVNGAAAGAGLGLALACDLRVAAEEARLVMAFAGIGAAADSGTSYFLPRLAGVAQAAELHFLNEPLQARRALELGLVNAVVPTAELSAKSLEMARRLAAGPTGAYAQVKQLLNATWGASLQEHLAKEAQAITQSARTEDFLEGVRAFTERRAPHFRGR